MTRVSAVEIAGWIHIVISGHAGYGTARGLKLGCDIVCAAVSMLGQTMAQVILDAEAEGKVKVRRMECRDGYIEIDATSSKRYREEVENKLSVIHTGFTMLADSYPDFVKLGWGNERKTRDIVMTDDEILTLGKDRANKMTLGKDRVKEEM